ncbi:unnamed protein product [Linum trigynum]|uniref:Uncharacterized protein n=1 Tax=Linum trigynum TaxID=586398 RepID=A0AAV2E9K8_9ROSI
MIQRESSNIKVKLTIPGEMKREFSMIILAMCHSRTKICANYTKKEYQVTSLPSQPHRTCMIKRYQRIKAQ